MNGNIQIGTLLGGRYEIIAKIGTGGMADVYKAKCRLLNRLVAVKVLKREFSDDSEFLRRFEVEAQAAASLSHPNIVSVYDVGFDSGRHYIVMELAEGITLKEYISQKGALGWREAAGYAAQICSALECAHKQGIIHRDIKPHNIIITKNGIAKVTDFGIARAATGSTMVADDTVIGSAHYLSPEQARGGYTDEKSDIYSAGITLYEMLTGKVPFDADSAVSIAMMHMSQKAMDPRLINPDIPESIEKIVMKAICKEQNGRYQSAGEMVADLNNALSNRAASAAPDSDSTRVIMPEGEIHHRRGAHDLQKKKTDLRKTNSKKTKTPFTKSEKRMVWMAAVAAGILLIAIAFMLISMFGGFGTSQWDETFVPNVEGKSLEEATQLLSDAKLGIEIEEQIASAQYEKDVVISQEPAAGRSVKKGAKIRVKISSGLDGELTVPNVVSYDKDNAVTILEKAGFKAVITEEESENTSENTVIRQSPSAGTAAKANETIRLYVAVKKEKEETDVPNVIGKSLAQAKNDIENAGLVVGNVAEEESEQSVGTVIRQSPSSGRKAEKKSAVSLTVSKGITATPTPTVEPTPQTQVKTITLPVPQDKESTQIRVVANGKEIHNRLHHKSEVTYDIRVTGRNSASLEIYHDGVLVGTQTITF